MRRLMVFLLLASACGGGDGALAPQPLVADSAADTGCSPAAVAAGAVRAKVIACAEELLTGRLAAGRVGDILLENSKVKLVIRAFGEGYYLPGTSPGGIVDAAAQGGEDLVKEILPIAGLQTGAFDEIVITEAGDSGPATVVVRGPITPIDLVAAAVMVPVVDGIIEHHYILEADADQVLLRTYLFPVNGSEETLQLGEVLFFGGTVQSWLPGKGPVTGSANAEFIASVGGSTSYGISYAPDAVTAVQFLDINNIKLALGASRTLGNGDPVDRWLILGDGSASSVTERAWELRGQSTGTLSGTTTPGVWIEVMDGDKPITRARADDTGNYRLGLLAGTYQVYTHAEGRADGAEETVSITAGAETTQALAVGGSGTLSLMVRDGDGEVLPARLVLRDASTRRIEYVGPTGDRMLGVTPGSYTLDVSRGMEYDAYTVDPLVITDGETTEVSATLTRVVDTAGWIAVDTHLHSEMSTDSTITLELRLLALAAEGVEVGIATDHDFVSDYTPVIEEIGIGAFVTAQSGSEVSSLVWGHSNTWPQPADYDRAAGGSVPWYGKSPGEVFAAMRASGGAGTIVQLNHPYSSSSGLFNKIDFDPATLSARREPSQIGLPATADLNDFSFDAVEVANDLNDGETRQTLVAWLALVQGGFPVTATASSDSHGRSTYTGNSRTYVYVGAGKDTPLTVDLAALNSAIKARKVTVSQGAFVTAELIDPGSGNPAAPGAMVDLSGQSQVTLHIKVQAAPWMSVASIKIYAGTEVVRTLALDASSTDAVRYDQNITMDPGSSDGFFVVLVEPGGRGDPVIGQPGVSLTNPLMYDRDGDGSWSP